MALSLDLIDQSLRRGGKLLIFDIGGSAADTQHLAAEKRVAGSSET